MLLSDFGLTTSRPVAANDWDSVVTAAEKSGYPVVLKTERPGLPHKTDSAGVIVGIEDQQQLADMYAIMRKRLGDDVLVAPVVAGSVEVFFGMRQDPQFGAVVLIGIGGVLAETISDVQFALPPFDSAHARRLFERLRLRAVFDGVRGARAVNLEHLCEQAERFSVMVHALGDVLGEVDVNPLIVNDECAVAVDAFVVGRDRRKERSAET